jgi:hypothetical protein
MTKGGKSAPDGSVSYKFIEQSVKNGALEDVNSHRITGAVRNPAAASRTSKGKRVPFTAADDQILSNWLARAEREGKALGGNKIFDELEAICPHHTSQSWKARYKNYKNLLPKPKITAPDPGDRGAARAEPVPAPQTRQHPPPATASSRSKTPAVAGTGKVKFTDEDDQLLLEYVEEAGKGKNGNKIYQALAEEHPHHSWHSWRDRYVRHLEPRLRAEASNNEPTPPVSNSRHTATTKPVKRESRTTSAEHKPAAPSVADAALPVATGNGVEEEEDFPSIDEILARKASHATLAEGHTNTQSAAIPDGAGATGRSSGAERRAGLSTEDFDLRLAKIELSKLIQTRGRGYLVRSALRQLDHYLPHLQAHSRGVLLRSKLRDFFDDDLVRLQAHASGALVRMALSLEEENDGGDKSTDGLEEQIAEDMTPRPPRHPKTPKEEFYTLFNEYLGVTGAQINQWPKIEGRTLDLWELWHTVKSLDQGRSPSIRNWEQIAETLGFDWIETPEVTLQLKSCYEANLGEFEELQEAFEAEDPGSQAELESQRSAAESDADTEVAEQKPPRESVSFHSSPPRILGQKRAFEPDPVSSSVDIAFSSVKRMRYSKDIEIPSSPEVKKAAAIVTAGLSWKKKLSFDRVAELQPRPAKARLEPETQDFGFEDGFQSQPDIVSRADTTPSQQLHIEDENLTPIPFSGFKLRDVPYRSPLGSRLHSNSSQRKVIPDSAAAGHTNGRSIISSIKDPDDGGMAKPRHVPAPDSESPIEAKAKRRSLPVSFRRAVSPPKAGAKLPSAAPARVSLPAAMANKRNTLLPANERTSLDPSRVSSKTRSRTTVSPAAPRVLPDGPTPPKDLSIPQTIDYYISLGYRKSHIIEAFKATLTWGLAAVVMQELKEGRGIPDNWAGVWTAKDDDDLKFVLRVEHEVGERRRSGKSPGREDRDRVRRAERLRNRLEGKHGLRRMGDRELSFKT